MSIISGNNITFLSSDIFEATGGIIERTGLTANSSDTMPTALNIISVFKGTSSIDPTGNLIEVYVLNSSETYTIKINSGVGMTMKPGPTDVIQPKTIKRYTIVVRSSTTVDLYNLDYNGTPIVTEKIITNVIENNPTDVQPVQIFNNITELTIGTNMNFTTNGDLSLTGNLFSYRSVASLSDDSDLIYSSGQILGGYIKRVLVNNRTDKLPTAASLVSAIENPIIGTSFFCYIQNASSSSRSLTITTNTGITLSGIDNNFARYFTLILLFVITNINQGTEAITCYNLGTLSSAREGSATLITTVTSNYTLLASDSTINVNASTVTLTLPLISSIGQKRYHITNINSSNTPRITINPSSGDTILGSNSFLLNVKYGSISMYNDEESNWILY